MNTQHLQTQHHGGATVDGDATIVVAVDGSERNASAVDWAVDEARRSGRRLLLAMAVDNYLVPTPHVSLRVDDEEARGFLSSRRDAIARANDDLDVTYTVRAASALDVILDQAERSSLVVVGKRGLGAFSRVIVGSTSIAVAGRSPVPVVVVPDTWDAAAHETRRIVVGVNTDLPRDCSLAFAFKRANDLNVPLHAMHGWELPVVYTFDAAAGAIVRQSGVSSSLEALEATVAPLRVRYPDVHVTLEHWTGHPAMGVLDRANEDGQLIVLGRHAEHRLLGFGFGSVTRAVLHYAECPVAVVPAERDDSPVPVAVDV